MARATVFPVLALLAGLVCPAGAASQQRPIQEFVQQVTQLWAAGDAGALVGLAAGRLLLDTGRGTETVNARHAGAALRALFSDHETVGARPVRITLAGGDPPRGFGELSWSYRTRGASVPQARTVYVGAVWERGEWRISELRVMP